MKTYIASVGFLEAFIKMASEKYQSKSECVSGILFLKKELHILQAQLNL